MIAVNEWLPNPTGKDAEGEWIEIVNTGGAPADMSGWYLTNGRQIATLQGVVDAKGYVLLPRSRTKLSLKNENGYLALFRGESEVQRVGFKGVAPEGKSFGVSGARFTWMKPTPGSINERITIQAQIGEVGFGALQPPSEFRAADTISVMFGVALLITLAVLFAIKSHEGISNLFFGRDPEIR